MVDFRMGGMGVVDGKGATFWMAKHMELESPGFLTDQKFKD